MVRTNIQNLSEKQTGIRVEPMFNKDEVKFCSQILNVWSAKQATPGMDLRSIPGVALGGNFLMR